MILKKNKILFATKNLGKLIEFKKALDRFHRGYEVISFNDLPYNIPDCEETGVTFEENALLKIRNTRRYLRGTDKYMTVIADDSGMKINHLHGEPGVFTRRWNGTEMSDDEIIDYCIEKLKGADNRSATYVSCFAVSNLDSDDKIVTGENLGVILKEPRFTSTLKGMPFRSLFFVPELDMMFHEVRDLPVSKRKDYILGHEHAIEQILDYLDNQA